MSLNLSIAGIQEAQHENIRALVALQPGGAGEKAVQFMIAGLHRYAVSITHVRTGALRASHQMHTRGNTGEVSIAAGMKNPEHGRLTSEYASYEHARGGDHAFYDRTIGETGAQLLEQAAELVSKAIP